LRKTESQKADKNIGEIAAAYTCGHLTAAQAIVVAYYRGDVVSRSIMQGAMMAAGLSQEQAATEIRELGLEDSITVACVNSPESVTISGDATAIEKLLTRLQDKGTFARKLKTDGRAYHSHHMCLLGQEYEDLLVSSIPLLEVLDRSKPDILWVSSVTGKAVTDTVDLSYWRMNLESPVLFANAVEELIKDTAYHLIEVGPHSALELPLKQIRTSLKISESKLHYSSALSRGKDSVGTTLKLMGNLYLHGHDIAFDKVNHVSSAVSDFKGQKTQASATQGKFLHDLPGYQWSYDKELWAESRLSIEYRTRKYPRHDLLGSQIHGGNGVTTSWRNVLKTKDVPWLEDHKLEQTIVFPGAGYIAMAIEAICQVTGTTAEDLPSFSLRNVNILKACVLSQDDGIEIFTTMQPLKISATSTSETWYHFAINSYSEGIATDHATGLIKLENPLSTVSRELIFDDRSMEPTAVRNWYSRFAKEGLNFGKEFQSLEEIHCHRGKKLMHAVTKTKVLQGDGDGLKQQSTYVVHPITIDALLQTTIIALTAGHINTLKAKVPVVFESVRICTPHPSSISQPWTIHGVSEPVGIASLKMNAELHDANGKVCVQLKQARGVAFQGAAQEELADERHPMLRVVWKPDIERLWEGGEDAFSVYLNRPGLPKAPNQVVKRLTRALDLVTHKNPARHILELIEGGLDNTKSILDALHFDSPFKCCRTYSRGQVADEKELLVANIKSGAMLQNDSESLASHSNGEPFDVVIVPVLGDFYFAKHLALIRAAISPDGILLGVCSTSSVRLLEEHGFSVLHASYDGFEIVLARQKKVKSKVKLSTKEFVLVSDPPLLQLTKGLLLSVSNRLNAMRTTR